ncbi:hypothetical protein A3Q56_08210, partial [Intoshia linei]
MFFYHFSYYQYAIVSPRTGYRPSEILFQKSLSMPIHNLNQKYSIDTNKIKKTNNKYIDKMKQNYDRLALKNLNCHAAKFITYLANLKTNQPTHTKRVLKAFKEKIIVYRRNVRDRNFDNMLDIQNSISDEDILHYCHYLTTLKEDFEAKFKDLFNLQIHSGMIDLFNCNINDAHCTVVEELITLQCDEEAKYRFEKGGNF